MVEVGESKDFETQFITTYNKRPVMYPGLEGTPYGHLEPLTGPLILDL